MELNLVNKALKTVIENTMPDMVKELEFHKMAYNNMQILMDKGIINWYRHNICKNCFALVNCICGVCSGTICTCKEHYTKCERCNVKICPKYQCECGDI